MDDKNQVYLTYQDGIFGWYCRGESELPGILNSGGLDPAEFDELVPMDSSKCGLSGETEQ